MKHLISLILFFSVTNAFTAESNSLLRFTCQKYYISDGELANRVFILEQTSIKQIDSSQVIDGSDLINPKGKYYTGETEFRMRIYNASLISDDQTKEEIIEELLKQEASRDTTNRLLDFKGTGGRLELTIDFGSKDPYNKSILIDLNDLSEAQMQTNSGATNMLEDGFYRCEEPVLIPYRD